MAFIQSLLFEHVQVNNFKADSYSSEAIAKQVQALEQVFGKDLELLKKAVSTNLNLNLAEKTHEAFEDSIIHLPKQKTNLNHQKETLLEYILVDPQYIKMQVLEI